MNTLSVLYAGEAGLKRLHKGRWHGETMLVRPLIAIHKGTLREGFLIYEPPHGCLVECVLPVASRTDAGYDLIYSYRILRSIEARSEIGGPVERTEAELERERHAIVTAVPPCLDEAIACLLEAGIQIDPSPLEEAVREGLLPWTPALRDAGVGMEVGAGMFAKHFEPEVLDFLLELESEPGSPFNRLVVEGILRGFEREVSEADLLLAFAFMWGFFASEAATAEVMPEPEKWLRERLEPGVFCVARHIAGRQSRLRSDLAPRDAATYTDWLKHAFEYEIGEIREKRPA